MLVYAPLTNFYSKNLQGAGMYSGTIKSVEDDIQATLKRVNELAGIKESDTGLAPPALWDLAADKQTLQSKFTTNIGYI